MSKTRPDSLWTRICSLSLVVLIAAVFAGCDSPPQKSAPMGIGLAQVSGPLPQLRISVQIERDGEIVSTPTVLIPEGERATIEIGERDGEGDLYSLVFIDDEVHVSAILRDGSEEIACPNWIVYDGEAAEVSFEGAALRSSFAVLSTVERF